MEPFPSSPGFFKRVVPTHPGDGGGAGPTKYGAQAWPALPVLVKARVCASRARKAEAGAAPHRRGGPALSARRVSGESTGVRACAERPPGGKRTFRSPRARARAREAKVHGGLGAAARARGRYRAASPALSRRRAILPVSPAVPALRLSPARRLSRGSLALPVPWRPSAST